MRYLLSIDPGKRVLGACLFNPRRELVKAMVSRVPAGTHLNEAINRHIHSVWVVTAAYCVPDVAVEDMRWRPNDSKSNPNKLLAVQAVGMAVAGSCLGEIHLYPASEWKASIPKSVHHERLVKVLTAEEQVVLYDSLKTAAKSHHKEILDALGIGLFHLKRTNKSGMRREK